MSEGVQPQLHVTQLFEENTNKRAALAPQPNGLAPAAPTGRQAVPTPTSVPAPVSTPTKGKVTCMSPEQAMKQFMSKMSSFEHHEVFSFPEGELVS